jgi:hypothetical protein
MATPTTTFELLQVVLKLVYGPLFRPPDIIPKALNIRNNIAREHEQVFARSHELTQGVDPFF